MKRFTACLLAFLLIFPLTAVQADTWYSFTEDDVPDGLAYTVLDDENGYTGTVSLTFLGDCTLGGEEKLVNSRYGFVKTVAENGVSWPFRNLLAVTGQDDITLANLEGVLSDRKLTKEVKEYNFIGPTSYTDILKAGSIECVTQANNHSHDYGEEGFADTKAALDKAGIARLDTETMAVWQRGTLMIGFVGAFWTLAGNQGKQFDRQVALLKDLGCAAVICVMHAGLEHVYRLNGYQKQIAEKAAAAGCCLVVGHHPHVAQGYSEVDGMPVAWSLGNCSFGGSMNPSDKDALMLGTELSFEDGVLTEAVLHFYPISISGEKHRNDYSPVLLSGDDAARVLKKMKTSSGYTMPDWEEGQGSVIRVEY